MQNVVTVLTPSYNRGSLLDKLYTSLEKQTNKQFEWLIVDDGSTDDTEEIAKDLIKKASFAISYTKKKNGGKHTALNVGIKQIKTPLTFIVDSDDYVTEDAVKTIIDYYEKYKEKNICGFSFLRQFPDGKVNGKMFSPNEVMDTYINRRVNAGDMDSDKAEVYFTDILLKFPFPEFKDERFLGEDVVWARLSREYQMIHINKPIYIGNYLEDGLTRNRRLNNIKSPNGCMVRANEYLHDDVNIRFREKCALQYLIYGWFAQKSFAELLKNANQKWLVILNILPAGMLYVRWKKEFEENN